ncbi:hypothetical protein ACQKGD_15225 [Peribacillus frigoritolerans]|uniref:hypothetical protein n=1 Tax=Peribacillus frigoritolerans TaxID=450367 RepID=UPI003D066FB4
MDKPSARIEEKVTDREFYVRDKILERNLEHCRSLTPEQVKTVLSIGDEYNKKQINHETQEVGVEQGLSYLEKGSVVLSNQVDSFVIPLLTIVLADINIVPVVHYKGEEISMKQRVSFDWITRGEFFNPTYISVEHQDKETQDLNTKVIQHNQPLGRSDG